MKNVAYNMDCMEAMREMSDNFFDLAVVDPPYRMQSENQPTRDMRKNGSLQRFGEKPTEEYFQELFRVSKTKSFGGRTILVFQITKGSWYGGN